MYWIPLLSACSTGLVDRHRFEFACEGLKLEFNRTGQTTLIHVGTAVLHVIFDEPGSLLEDGFDIGQTAARTQQ